MVFNRKLIPDQLMTNSEKSLLSPTAILFEQLFARIEGPDRIKKRDALASLLQFIRSAEPTEIDAEITDDRLGVIVDLFEDRSLAIRELACLISDVLVSSENGDPDIADTEIDRFRKKIHLSIMNEAFKKLSSPVLEDQISGLSILEQYATSKSPIELASFMTTMIDAGKKNALEHVMRSPFPFIAVLAQHIMAEYVAAWQEFFPKPVRPKRPFLD